MIVYIIKKTLCPTGIQSNRGPVGGGATAMPVMRNECPLPFMLLTWVRSNLMTFR